MPYWRYKTTTHRLGDIPSGGKRIIVCDDKGHCLVHDLSAGLLEALEGILNAEGREGWELVQCQYHEAELFCLWKRQEGEG